ncbi:MAG: hypothetical protein PHY42_01195 [Bacilli bacterium]|jgi:ABC-2 type transport system ATP-binding protein|nr:hypothetical protein [Bacilli bacterium]
MSVLVCENISMASRRREAIKNFSYNFLDQRIYTIVGKTESGQSDLLDLITARRDSSEGILTLDGEQLHRDSPDAIKICYLPPDTTFASGISVFEIFKMMAAFFPNWDTYYAYELASYFDINYKASYGSLNEVKKSLLIGILSLATRANMTVLYHPVEQADIKSRYDFFNFLYAHQEKYPRTFIIATNMVDEIDYLTDQLLLLDKGKLISTFNINELQDSFKYLTGKSEVLRSLITGIKVIGYEERGKTLTVCIREKLRKDDIRKYQKYLIKISEVPIQKIIIYLISLREKKGVS